MIGLVTDSNAQLPDALVARYRVEVVPLTVVVDGVDHLEGVDLDADGFWACFERGTPQVSTSQPSPGRFATAYATAAESGADEILSVHIGSNASGTVNAARLAAADAPVPVRIVDTGAVSFAIACCVWEAAEAVAAGASLDQAATVAERVASTVGNVFVVGGLDLVRAGGRLAPGVEATGRIPVLSMVSGQVQLLEEVSDVDGAARAMAGRVVAAGPGLRVGVGMADRGAEGLAAAFERHLRAASEVRELVRYRVGPSVGAHSGPGTVGAFYYVCDERAVA